MRSPLSAYLELVEMAEGNPKWEQKVVKYLLRANVGHKHRTVVDDKHGKPSETHFRVIKRFEART